MEQSELKIRVTFASAAVVALCAAVTNLFNLIGSPSGPWLALAAPAGAFALAVVEALGLHKVSGSPAARLLVSVLIGVACLGSLQT